MLLRIKNKFSKTWADNCNADKKRKLKGTKNKTIIVAFFEFFNKYKTVAILETGLVLQ